MTITECRICPTKTFCENFSLFLENRGEKSSSVRSLVEAIKQLKSYDWDGSLPIKPYGSSGDSFAFSFSNGYIFTFRRETKRDERKQPIFINLYLKTIQSL